MAFEPSNIAIDAAVRIVDEISPTSSPPARVLHASAWILGRAGRRVPEAQASPGTTPLHVAGYIETPQGRLALASSQEGGGAATTADHVVATVAAARGDLDEVRRSVERARSRSVVDGSAVLQGIAALGDAFSALAFDLALTYRDLRASPDLLAAGLARTTPARTDELLALLREPPYNVLDLTEAVTELVVHGRDRGQPHARAEEIWDGLLHTSAGGTAPWWRGRLRLLSRTDPALAGAELLDAFALVGRKAMERAQLTLVRWARIDPVAATRFVDTYAPRVGAWGGMSRGLTFDGIRCEGALDGWDAALATAETEWSAGQLVALAVRLGDFDRVRQVLDRHPLPGEVHLSYSELGLRLLARDAPSRAAELREKIASDLPDGERPGELRDWLTVLTAEGFDLPWWRPYLPDPP